MSTKKLIVAIAALGVSAAAFAGGYVNRGAVPVATTPAPAVYSNDGAGFVVGVQGGWADTHQANFTAKDPITGAEVTLGSGSDTGFAARGYLGYDFNKYLGVEAGYTYLPKTTFDNNGGDIKNYAVDLLGKISYPVNNVFSVFAKAGAAYLNQKIESADGSASQTNDGIVPAFGVGAAYQIIPNLAVDASWLRYSSAVDSSDDPSTVDFASLGVSYKFPVG